MSHARVDALIDLRTKTAQNPGCVVHALNGNVEIGVTAADEGRGSCQGAFVGELHAQRADQPAGEGQDTPVTSGIASSEFRAQARALGESPQHNAFGRNTESLEFGHEVGDHLQGGGQKGLVLRKRGDEALRIPDIAGRLGDQDGGPASGQRLRDRNHGTRGCAAAVYKNQRRCSLVGIHTATVYPLSLMNIGAILKISHAWKLRSSGPAVNQRASSTSPDRVGYSCGRSQMRGDVVIIEDHHRTAAGRIADFLAERVRTSSGRFTLTVAGESGSGKSETGAALAEAFSERGFPAVVLGQDDYFHLPPKSNDHRRREDISRVGMQEVRLDLLDEHLRAARAGAAAIRKPEVIYEEDRAEEIDVALEGVKVVIAEGTYTTALEEADVRVFIDRDFRATLEARKRRNREQFDPFIEKVLEIEHRIIQGQRERADIVIPEDFDLQL